MSSKWFSNLNSGIEGLKSYEPGRPIADVIEEFGLGDVIKLASNENPLGASPIALAQIPDLLDEAHLYPDGNGTKLKQSIATHEKLSTDNVVLGNGSNEILELVARAFLNPQSSSLASAHAFAVYKIVTQASGSKLIEVPTVDWSHDLPSFPGYLEDDTKVVFIANPNNPTGTYNSHQEVESLLAVVPSSVLVVLDCAYHEYVTEGDYVDIKALLKKFDNLIVTKSFSKIHGLASARVGYGLGSPELIEVLNRIRQPFNTNSFAQELACAAINDKEHIAKSVELNTKERAHLFESLNGLGLECIPSVGNFISFKGPFNGKEMFQKLMEKGVIIRSIDLYDMPDYLRVTVGTSEENAKFLQALTDLL